MKSFSLAKKENGYSKLQDEKEEKIRQRSDLNEFKQPKINFSNHLSLVDISNKDSKVQDMLVDITEYSFSENTHL